MDKPLPIQLIRIIGLCIIAISCSASENALQPTIRFSATGSPTKTEVTHTALPEPTATMTPSDIPEPTETLPPSSTNTSTPKASPLERLNIQGLCFAYSAASQAECPIMSDQLAAYNIADLTFPEPIVLEGSGDNSKLNFYNPFDISIVHIVGNADGRDFKIRAITPDSHGGNKILVNTTEPYDGFHPIDLHERQHTLNFEITASGDWRIELLPLADARVIEVPGVIAGSGDDAILMVGGTPDSIMIKGNPDSQFFKITAYGNAETQLVNTSEPFEGTITLPPDTVLLEINSQSIWEITGNAG